VSLIGAHLDYNGGFVLPVAIHLGTYAAARSRPDGKLVLRSLHAGTTVEARVAELEPRRSDGWANYPKGVAAMLLERGYAVGGAEVLYWGTMPVGAGVSSSASIEVLTATLLAGLGGFSVPPLEVAKLCKRAENDFVGVACGIMDQLAVAFGRRGQAILLDCRELSIERIPFDPTRVAIVLSDSGVRRELSNSPFNDRVRECREALEILQRRGLPVRDLRDVTAEAFVEHSTALPEALGRRVTHVVREIERVFAFAEAFRAGELERAGQIVSASHRSTRDYYETSGTELDALYQASLDVQGVYGTRATGAGFGGCTVSLVKPEAVEAFVERVGDAYRARTGREATFHVVESSDPAREF
jgi:galactokinase